MARPRRTVTPKDTAPTYTNEQIRAWGVLFDRSYALGGVSSQSAVVFDKHQHVAEAYFKEFKIGKYDTYTDKNGVTYHGWYLSLEERLEILTLLEQHQEIACVRYFLDADGWLAHRKKLERAVNPTGKS